VHDQITENLNKQLTKHKSFGKVKLNLLVIEYHCRM